ncbi:MAG: TetR/AcrR family transcriptional regulator [Lachnospiraceae bacterium]
MAKDKAGTYNKILTEARAEFLANGYENTSMRNIAARVGITAAALYRHFADKESMFSALIQPALDEFDKMLTADNTELYERFDQDQLECLWGFSEERFEIAVSFIYQHFDAFKLLLTCSAGTRFQNFQHDLVVKEVKSTMKIRQYMISRGIHVNIIDEQDLHLIMSGFISTIFEFIIHDYSRKDAMKHIGVLSTFFHSGLNSVLGF